MSGRLGTRRVAQHDREGGTVSLYAGGGDNMGACGVPDSLLSGIRWRPESRVVRFTAGAADIYIPVRSFQEHVWLGVGRWPVVG